MVKLTIRIILERDVLQTYNDILDGFGVESNFETWGWIKIGLINCFCYRVFRALLIHARVM